MRKKSFVFGIVLAILILSASICPGPKPPDRPTVIVRLCETSGLLPNEYCPKTEDVRFFVTPKPDEPVPPTETCAVHVKPDVNPPVGPPWVGASFYQSIAFSLDDVFWFTDGVANNGGNILEFFVNFTWPADSPDTAGWPFQPFLRIGSYQDDAFPGVNFPKFDLNLINPEIFDKWRAILRHVNARGLWAVFRIWDFCSWKTRLEKRYDVRRANRQRIDDGLLAGDPENKIRPYFSAFSARFLELVREELGDHFFIVPENEADYLRDVEDSDEKVTAIVVDRMTWFVKDLESKGVPRERIILNVSWGLDRLMSLGTMIEIHGINSDVRISEYLSRYPVARLFLNGDGPDPNAEGAAGDSPSKRGMSIDQARRSGVIIRARRPFGYAYFERATENARPASARRATFDVLRTIAAETFK